MPNHRPSNYDIIGLEVQAYDAEDTSKQPLGNWNAIDDGDIYGCSVPNDTVGEFHFPEIVNKTEYQYKWTPEDDSISAIVFRYTIFKF